MEPTFTQSNLHAVNTEQTEMKRELGLFDSTMIVVGSMIGSGIFIVTSDIARLLGSPFWILFVWLLTGVITLIAALSYGELAGMMPKAGGQYVYLREAYNKLVGFLFGWTTFMVIQTGTIAAVAIAFAKYTGVLLPTLINDNPLFIIGALGFSSQQFLGVALIVVLTIVNLYGVKNAKIIQGIFTVAKIVSLLGLIVLGIAFGLSSDAFHTNFTNFFSEPFKTVADNGRTSIIDVIKLSGWSLIGAIGGALVGSLFSSDAWNNITYTAGEVKEPKRNIPLSLFFGTLIVTVLYILANVAYLTLLPVKGDPSGADVLSRGIMFATNDRVATAGAEIIFGSAAVIIMAVLIMVSTFGCNNGLIMAGARLYYAMAKDGLFISRAEKLNDKGVPAFGLIIQCFWASLLCFSGKYNELLDYVIFAVLIFYSLTIGGIFILRKTQPDVERPYKAFGYPFIPALYIVLATAICIDLLIVKSGTSLIGLGIVLAGIPVYFLTAKNRKTV
ncbi:APC family permease [Solitalea canadensis]|uniref:Amino acid transporter n=1 Tax=Solitalea canadensis (strain ATCC 29591 / DSM 3403 / JCM 21819 / LMG 8368 / NBRC 15130 / NCIMB 12057 / USAM 9D) TaxID=929556 RepID=H8KY54_SOLCM|nr:amino acid permease [Solitalea canadensis]AFD05792.1 amino acid transporter [Solitalea canadensis DSM 3403]